MKRLKGNKMRGRALGRKLHKEDPGRNKSHHWPLCCKDLCWDSAVSQLSPSETAHGREAEDTNWQSREAGEQRLPAPISPAHSHSRWEEETSPVLKYGCGLRPVLGAVPGVSPHFKHGSSRRLAPVHHILGNHKAPRRPGFRWPPNPSGSGTLQL